MDYDTLRKTNIERNKRFLSEIGLDVIDRSKVSPNTIRPKRKRAPRTSHEVPERRSLRIAELPPPSYKDFVVIYGSGNSGPKSNIHLNLDKVNKWPEVASRSSKSAPKYDPLSSRFVKAQFNVFLDNPDLPLSTTIEDTGKAAIMAMANNGQAPKFSKMPGVVRWGNGFFLWVNMSTSPPSEGDSGDSSGGGYYPNRFLEGGRYLTWFGSDSMRPDSDTALDLLGAARDLEEEVAALEALSHRDHTTDDTHQQADEAVSTGDTRNTTLTQRASPDPFIARNGDISAEEELDDSIHDTQVLLFVREGTDPYACLGRVTVSELNLTAKPIRVTWKLADFEANQKSELFQRIVSNNS